MLPYVTLYSMLTLKTPIPKNGQTHSNKTICLSVFDHFMNLALKGLTYRKFDLVSVHVHLQSGCFFVHFLPFQRTESEHCGCSFH